MPPQPLSSKQFAGPLKIDPAAVMIHPELGAKIAEVFAYWARMESLLGTILARMMEAHARPTLAMYEAIRNTQTQMDVIVAAAKTALSTDLQDLFSALLVITRRAGNTRHKMAHWLWASTPKFPDCLVLVEPEAMLNVDRIMSDLIAALKNNDIPTAFPHLNFTRAFLWEPKHFDEAVAQLQEANDLMFDFASLIITPASAALDSRLREKLLNAPRIQEALHKPEQSKPDAR